MNARIRAVLAGLPRDPPPIPPSGAEESVAPRGRVEEGRRRAETPQKPAKKRAPATPKPKAPAIHAPFASRPSRCATSRCCPAPTPTRRVWRRSSPRQGVGDAPLRRRDVPAVPQARAGLPGDAWR